MKRFALLACIALVLACVGCGGTDDTYAMVSLRNLPVGHVIKESDIITEKIGLSHRERLHPFRPRPNTEFTTDASSIVGHTVKTFIQANQAISPQRDLD